MTESAALLVDEVLPNQPPRQWVLSLPFALRFLLATDPQVLTQVLGIAYRTIASYLINKAGVPCTAAETGAVTLIQRFGSAVDDSAMSDLLGHSITYRVAVGPRAGEKVFTLQPVPPMAEAEPEMAQESGFSLHAGVGAEGGERGKLERLCR